MKLTAEEYHARDLQVALNEKICDMYVDVFHTLEDEVSDQPEIKAGVGHDNGGMPYLTLSKGNYTLCLSPDVDVDFDSSYYEVDQDDDWNQIYIIPQAQIESLAETQWEKCVEDLIANFKKLEL